MIVGAGLHLTYCSNIHAGESWNEVRASVGAALPEIRARMQVSGPMALGLRLSAGAAETLSHPATLDEFRAFLRAGDYYVPTINGFPYGAFHHQRVKEQVYLPDWRDPERLRYTNGLASLLAALLADRPDLDGAVSTVPGAFKAHIASDNDLGQIAANLLAHAAHLVRLRARTGVTVTLAIEPEPACVLETVDETVAFFTQFLFSDALIAAASRAHSVALHVDDVRRHLGVCFDACHMAVEFEDPAGAVERLERAGIAIHKVQISAALRIANPVDGSPAREALRAFAEDTYLHQVVARGDGRLTRYTDLPDALAATGAHDADTEWRVHFHVPVFLPRLHAFDSTQPDLIALLALLRERAFCRCLEVETYTWNVLPAEYRTVGMHEAIARELSWVRTRIEG